MSTPQYFTKTMAAGARSDVQGSAQFLTIYSTTAGAAIEFGFGDDALVPLSGPLTIDFGGLGQGERAKFRRVVFRNGGALPATVTGYFSNIPISGVFSELTTLAAIQTLLASIDADTDNLALILAALGGLVVTSTPVVYNAATRVPMQAPAQTGNPATQIVVANAATTLVEIVANPTNAGQIYLAYTNDATSTLCITALAPGGSWSKSWAGDVYAVSDNGTDLVCGAIY